MKFSLIFSKGKRETERGSSALGKGLVACLLLMSVSCMLFVGTTMSWFTDQKTGTAGVKYILHHAELAVQVCRHAPYRRRGGEHKHDHHDARGLEQ